MKIINVPIEPLEERYSIQWDKWFKRQFEEAELDVTTVYGTKTKGKIIHGSFLDVLDTNMYKTSQLQRIINLLLDFDDSEPLVLFFHDLWFPGLTNIAYIRDGMRWKNLYICGCLHAGSYDENDFLFKQGMASWARPLETAMFCEIVDQIYVATHFHKALLQEKLPIDPDQIRVTGFPLYPECASHIKNEKENIIVFPHRLDSEKQPDLFDKLKEQLSPEFPGWTWIKTKEVATSKSEYYDILGKAKIAISLAKQETWGIAMQEAILCGCLPLCPNKLSYPEVIGNPAYLYSDVMYLVGARRGLRDLVFNPPPPSSLQLLQSEIIRRGREAIPRIIEHIKILPYSEPI